MRCPVHFSPGVVNRCFEERRANEVAAMEAMLRITPALRFSAMESGPAWRCKPFTLITILVKRLISLSRSNREIGRDLRLSHLTLRTIHFGRAPTFTDPHHESTLVAYKK
jgi:hypothetical protein